MVASLAPVAPVVPAVLVAVVAPVCVPAPFGKYLPVDVYSRLASPTILPIVQMLDAAVFDWGLVPTLDRLNSRFHAFALSEYAVIVTLV